MQEIEQEVTEELLSLRFLRYLLFIPIFSEAKGNSGNEEGRSSRQLLLVSVASVSSCSSLRRPCIVRWAEHNTFMQRTIGYFWRFYFTLASEGPPVVRR